MSRLGPVDKCYPLCTKLQLLLKHQTEDQDCLLISTCYQHCFVESKCLSGEC